MGRQIIKQPNGKFCIFSTETNNITDYNMSSDEIIESFTNEYRVNITKDVNEVIAKIESNQKPYFQFTLSYQEILATIKRNHSKVEFAKLKSEMENNITS